ncbi:dockerin type 1 [Colletotrichum truncatum]|uniref:Dockerin type 1 n=1 Tax=Colletotrichum truncatum TaxID=5467 RepID=A0ACC3YP83_COLTU|nr:dockerin type 1 [Colletotrichum truncatum]KAF6784174.1 dockerin type 1 [Colletotrichum truncatum]
MAPVNQLLFALFLQGLAGSTYAAPQQRWGYPSRFNKPQQVSNPEPTTPASVTVEAAAEPAKFEAQPTAGPGGSNFKDSDHFRVYGAGSGDADKALGMLESAYDCFVHNLGWRSTGLSFNDDSNAGPFYKTNIYSVGDLGTAAGVMHSEYSSGAAWLEVVDQWLTNPGVTVHEWGHGLHYHQKTWVDQADTGAWWETVANWVQDTYQTSPLCAESRQKHNQEEGRTEFNMEKTLVNSHQVIVDGTAGTGNYYEAWPFLTYLTNNPDNLGGLGKETLHKMMTEYKEGSNETPLHTLDRVASNNTAGDVVGAYWARMAYVDIGHDQAQSMFLSSKGRLNFDSVEGSGSSYKAKSDRAPRYMGANIIPLKVTGSKVDAKVTSAGEFTATLSIFDASTKKGRYVTLVNGAGSATIATGEEVSLVVANTPKAPIQYNGFKLEGSEANKGLDYSFTLTGATTA